ncbi:hypothetical protein Trydic_g23194 [Trypoxylus dichotomus]
MHRSGIPRRRQSLRQGLAPGPTPEDAPSRHLQGNGQAHSLLSPQEDLQSQAGRTAVHSEDGGPQRGRPQQARSPKKKVRQRAGSHIPRGQHSLATRSQILGRYARFPGNLGSPHTPRARPRTSDVGNPLSDDDRTREARSLV